MDMYKTDQRQLLCFVILFMKINIMHSGLDISARPLDQASAKTVGRVQITNHSRGLASTIFSSRIQLFQLTLSD